MKTALTIAGSDSCGGAGIQADIKTMTMNGVYAMSAITALTAQNTTGVTGIMEVTPDFLASQLDAVFTDIRPDAIKTGMVASSDLIRVIAEKLKQYDAKNIVVDPVMVATSGAKLISDDAIETLRNLQLCLAHKVYIDAIYESVAAGVGSRGSQITLDPTGTPISSVFPSNWRPQSEDQTFRKRVFYTFLSSSSNGNNSFATRCFWRDAKPIPEPDEWFENVWRDYREGKIYNRSRFDAGASGD